MLLEFLEYEGHHVWLDVVDVLAIKKCVKHPACDEHFTVLMRGGPEGYNITLVGTDTDMVKVVNYAKTGDNINAEEYHSLLFWQGDTGD